MKSSPSKKTYIFVGGFKSSKDGTLGGVQFACRSLVASQLADYVNWKLVDSTQRSASSKMYIRLFDAVKRICLTVGYLLSRKTDGILVFSPFSKYSFSEKGVMCILGKLFRKKVVLSIRSEIKLSKMMFFNRFATFADAFVRFVLRCCDEVICSNQTAADILVELFHTDREKITVIGNWLDAKPYLFPRPNPSSHESINTLLFVGWMTKEKGIYELIDAFKNLIDKNYPIMLTMCGGGTEFESIREKCKDLNIEKHVKFCGWVSGEEKYEQFRNADLFVFPSYTEGMPNALIEAMASGLAVVTTPVGGIPALITHDENGLLVEPATVEPLRDAIEHLITNPNKARQMGHKNRQRILENHNLEFIWKKFAAVMLEHPIDGKP